MFFEPADGVDIDGEWQYGDSKIGSSIARIETSLRCSICSDFFNNPHSLPCGHSFCSECIRKHLDKMFNPTTSDICPSCREKAVVSQLRVSRDLIDIVQYFRDARSGILAMLNQDIVDSKPISSSTRRKSNVKSDEVVSIQRMPHRVFHIETKDKVKRALEKLTENCSVKIRTDGDKDALVKRYSEFVHLNNAQLSSKFPLSVAEIVTELHRRERALEKTSHTNKKTENIIKDLKNGHESATVKKGFADLVKKARDQKVAKLRALSADTSASVETDHNPNPPAPPTIPIYNLDDDDPEGFEFDTEAAHTQTLFEYSQSQVSDTGAGVMSQERKRGIKRKLKQDRTSSDVLHSSSVARGKAIHGHWCVVWSDVMERLFFYNIQTETGQVDVPEELRGVYGSGKEGPGVAQLRANMREPTDRPIDCTLRESQVDEEFGDGLGLELTGSQSERVLTQGERLLRASSSMVSCSSLGLSPMSQLEQTQQKSLFIVDDSPYNSMDESQSSTDPLLRLSAGRRLSSSYDIAAAVMRKMETTATGRSEGVFDDESGGEGHRPSLGSSQEESNGGIVACPQCTFHNPSGNTRCDMCEAKLPVQVRRTRLSGISQGLDSPLIKSSASSTKTSKKSRKK